MLDFYYLIYFSPLFFKAPIILNMALFSAIIINTIRILPNDQESFYGYTSYYMLLIYWTIHMFSWGFYQKQDKIRLNLFKDSE